MPQTIRVGALLGRLVLDSAGEPVGRIEEIRAVVSGGVCLVCEYVTGTRGAFERLSAVRLGHSLFRMFALTQRDSGLTIAADLMDVSDERGPRLRCRKRDLPRR